MLLFALLAGCDVDMHEIEICTYTVQLRYDYNEENTTDENKIVYWVKFIDEYIFDENDKLYHIRRVTDDMCTDYMNSELQLEAGKYSILAVGNGDCSTVWDARTGQLPVVGMTDREDLRMTLENADTFEDGTRGPCGELFHGYRTFTVREEGGATRVRVDMVNAHFQVRFRVTWRNSPVPKRGTYYAVLEDVVSQYRLMPEWLYPAGSFVARQHDTRAHDDYPWSDNRVIHHLVHSQFERGNVIDHSNTTYLNADSEVWGQFVNYRVKNATPLIMKLYFAPDGTRGENDPMVLPREIDLGQYFAHFGYNLAEAGLYNRHCDRRRQDNNESDGRPFGRRLDRRRNLELIYLYKLFY